MWVIVILTPPLIWAGYRDPDHIRRTFNVVTNIGSLGSGVGTGGIFSEYNGIIGYNRKSILYNFIMLYGKLLPINSLSFLF